MSEHLQQLYTGLWMLHQAGVIELTQRTRKENVRYAAGGAHLKDAGHAHMDVEINNELRLHFDTHDSMEIARGELESCDIYLKRSYLPAYVDQLPATQARKVLPLGLNYRVLPNTIDLLALRRSVLVRGSFRRRASVIGQAVDIYDLFGFRPRLRQMESVPELKATPRVLFLVAAYDPFDDPERAPDKVEERIQMNETRAQCIRLLRKEFGELFFGGFVDNHLVRKHYGDLAIPHDATSQKNYVAAVKAHAICIASTGLHGSIGWKLAEYVALSKAIISERLIYQVPGNFQGGQNYLEFTSPESCVEAAIQLMQNANLRSELMLNNAVYYHAHLRPDALMLYALLSAMKRKSGMTPTFAAIEH